MNIIFIEQLPALFQAIGNLFAEKKTELCALDAKLGDGDLGVTMSKGFGALPDQIQTLLNQSERDIGKILMKVGMQMASLIPSTMGFLMSNGIIEGGKALKGRSELDGSALAAYLSGFASGIQKRGKCAKGQRTIYDAIQPAAAVAEKIVSDDPRAELERVISAAEYAAKSGVEETKNMSPVFGKAAVRAAQCKGIEDQGALAGYYMLLAMKNYICS